MAGILDDLEKQLGADPMRQQVVNIMQHMAKSFIIHLANAEQVEAFMAQGLTFRGHLLRMSRAKNTTTVIPDRVPYGLPEASVKLSLSWYGEVKSLRPVTHNGYRLSKYKLEMVINQDIPSRITVQGNHLNVFYRNQPRSCFVCSGAGHEAKHCPKKAANKRPAPADPPRDGSTKVPRTYAAKTASIATDRPPAGDPAAETTSTTTTDGVPTPVPEVISTTTESAVAAQDQHPEDSSDRPGETPFSRMDTSTTSSTHVVPTVDDMEVTEQRSGADPPSTTADPPTSAVPVPPHNGTDSTHAIPPSTEQPTKTALPADDPPSNISDTFPNLEHFFEDTPPSRLLPRPEAQDSSSNSSSSQPIRSKRAEGDVTKKTKATHMSTVALGAGVRKRTTPQAVCGTKKKSVLTQNQYYLLSDALNDETD